MSEISRRKLIIKTRLSEYGEKTVIYLAMAKPALGQLFASKELAQRGIMVSSGGFRLS